MTIPFEEIEAELLTDTETRAAYDALEPAYQIASLRIERRLTQAQLAALVGTKQPSIAGFELGDSEPTPAFLHKLAEPLNMRLEVNFIPVESIRAARESGCRSRPMSWAAWPARLTPFPSSTPFARAGG